MIIINYNIESEDKGSLPLFHKIFHQNFTQPIHQHLLSKPLISSCFPKTKYFDLRTIYLQLHDGFPVWIAIVRIFSSYLQKKSFYCRLFVSIFSELLFLYIGLFGSFLFNFLREKHDQTDDCKKKSNEQGNEVQLVAIFHLNSIEVVNGMLWYWKHFFKERI